MDFICRLEGDAGVEVVCAEPGKEVGDMFAAVDCVRSVAGVSPDLG